MNGFMIWDDCCLLPIIEAADQLITERRLEGLLTLVLGSLIDKNLCAKDKKQHWSGCLGGGNEIQ